MTEKSFFSRKTKNPCSTQNRGSPLHSLSLCLSVLMAIFPGEPGLAGVYRSKGWWRWWWQLHYWSNKSCKAPVKSSPTNQHLVFFTGQMPFLSPNQQCQSTEGKNITFHGLAYPKLTWVFQLCLWPLIAPGYLGKGCHASHQPSDASTPGPLLHSEFISENNLQTIRWHMSAL